MKKKMVILLFLSICFLLAATDLNINELQANFDTGKDILLSRLDYGTSMGFLPMNLAMALGAAIYYPVEYVVLEWDTVNLEWVLMYNYFMSYTDGNLTQYSIIMNMGGTNYEMTIDLVWEDSFLTHATNNTIINGNILMTMEEQYFYTVDGLFDSYLAQQWDAENEILVNADQWNTTIVDGKITVIHQDEWDEDMMNWRQDERLTYTWDGELITCQLEEYFDNQVWTNNDIHYMYYLDDGRMDYILLQVWQNDWVNGHKDTYEYEDNYHTYTLTEIWEEDAWINSEREFTTYDDSDRPEFANQEMFEEGEWYNDKETYFYYTTAGESDELHYNSLQLSAYPNPFNPTTTLCWQTDGTILPERVMIYNLLGKKVNELSVTTAPDGSGSVRFDGCDFDGNVLPSGIYFYSIPKTDCARKLLLMK